MKHLKTNVCIIGSGIAGSLCAKYLAPASKDILIVERGSHVDLPTQIQTGKYETDSATSRHNHRVTSPVMSNDELQYVYALGGSTNQWMGQAPRLIPNDFRMKTMYGVMEDWLVDYDELEPFYCIAEEEMGVAGGSDNPAIPRSKPHPLPPHPFSPSDELFRRCFPPGSIVSASQARPTRDIDSRPACCGSATCWLCPVDSKYTTLNTHIPQLRSMPSIRFEMETVVVSLKTNGARQVVQALAKNKDGQEISIEANLFVLAANALENAAILLRSRDVPQHPSIGRYIFDHPIFRVVAGISEEGFPYHGNSIWTAHCYHFYDGAFRSTRTGALGEIMNVAGLDPAELVWMVSTSRKMRGQALRKEVEKEFRHQISIEFLLEDIPSERRYVKLGSARDELGLPVTEVEYDQHSEYVFKGREHIVNELRTILRPLGLRYLDAEDIRVGVGHMLGTCRMGDEPWGVVDSELRYHQMDNLYVLGGSAFPTYSPANPTPTIAALSIRLAEHLKQRL